MAARQAAPPRRPPSGPTHFLCIPLARRQLARNIDAFRAGVTDINSFALPPDAIRPPGTLHLTLGVMSLPQQAQIDRAVSLLQHLKLRDVLAEARASLQRRQASTSVPTSHQTMAITLQGLHAMQDPAKSSVLFAPPLDLDEEGRETNSGVLYTFCKAVRQAFIDAGIMEAESRPLVLHATVVNTIYVKGRNGAGRRKERLTLDARDLLGLYEDHVWLDRHEVRTVALCRMGAQPVGRDGDQAYEVVADVRI